MSRSLLEAIGVTCELTGTQLSEGAMRVLAEELKGYPEAQVLAGLRTCCKELKGRLTLAEVLDRLDDGRPGVEEAWATVSAGMSDGSRTIVWTDDMREAYGTALLLGEDAVAARMAFKERYLALVRTARDRKEPVKWSLSLGSDPHQRETAILEGVKQGRLRPEYAAKFLRLPEDPQTVHFLESLCPRLLS